MKNESWTHATPRADHGEPPLGLPALSRTSSDVRPPCYGMELILDLHGCDTTRFTRNSLRRFFEILCDDVLNMERQDLHFWDDDGLPPEECQSDPRTKGTTAIQFILTSNVTIHCLDLLEAVYLNIFSCEEFDPEQVESFSVEYFQARRHISQLVRRH